ncbi:MAG TPA: Ig-like domain-containing protein [Longimicrobiales bacterium]|nr:Ig-like domain-containing protein [Longimicrobiales bacterium]
MMRRTALLALITLVAGCDSGPDGATLPLAPELDLSVVAAAPAQVSVQVFGPVRVVREVGTPVIRTLAINIPDPTQFAAFQLRVTAEAPAGKSRGAAVPSARVHLNGVEILGPSDLPKDGSWTVPVSLAVANILEVLVLGAPGGTLTFTVEGTLKRVADVVAEPSSLELEVGETAGLAVTVLAADGTVLTGREVTWSTSDGRVAQVSAAGAVSALAPGTTTVVATVEGVQDAVDVLVVSGEALALLGAEILGVHGTASGGVLAVGRFSGTLTLGGVTLTSRGEADLFAVSLARNGDVGWVTHLGSGSEDSGGKGAVDRTGDLFVVGYARAPVSVSSPAGGGTLVYGGGLDGFLVKLRGTDGGMAWGMGVSSGANDLASSVTVDPAGDAYLTGVFNGCCPSFGSATLRCTTGASLSMGAIGYQTGFLAKISSNGTPVWVVRGGSRDMGVGPVELDPAGNAYFGGNFRSWSGGTPATFVDAGGEARTVANGGIGTGFLVKVDPAGRWHWGVPIGNVGTGPDAASYPTAIRVLSGGTVAVSGVYWAGGASMQGTSGPPVTLPTANGTNAYLGAYDAAGRVLWGQRIGLSGHSIVADMLELPDGTFLAGGYFDQSISVGTVLTSGGGYDMFLGRYADSGVALEVEQFGAAGHDVLNGMGQGPSGGLILGGAASSGAIMGGQVAQTSGGFVFRR